MVTLGPVAIPIGLLLEMLGAFMMAAPDLFAGRFMVAAPDLPVVRQGARAVELEEGRRRLLDMGRLERDDARFEPVADVIADHWDAEFTAEPQAFAFDDHPGRQGPMLCVLYDEDPPQVSDEVSIRTRLGADAFDWVSDETTVYDWLGEEIVASERETEFFRGAGAAVLAIGVALQGLPSLLELVV